MELDRAEFSEGFHFEVEVDELNSTWTVDTKDSDTYWKTNSNLSSKRNRWKAIFSKI